MLSLQNEQPNSTTDAQPQKVSRAQRRKAAFAGKNISSCDISQNSRDDNLSLSSSPSFEIPSLHEPFSSVASYVELIAKRIRALRKLWTKIQKYEEVVENGGGKVNLNKDQIDALNRKAEVFWSFRELDDFHKQATTFENEEALRLRRIKQEADRANAIAIAHVRGEERKAADARVLDAVKSVHALLNVMPTLDVLSDQEVGILEAFKNFMFGEVLAQQNAIDHTIPNILSKLESGAEVPFGNYDMTYAHIKPLIDKVLYLVIPTTPSSVDAAIEEQDVEAEILFAADQYAEAHEEAADVLLSDASALYTTAVEMREVAQALHSIHNAEENAAEDIYAEQSAETSLAENFNLAEEQSMNVCGFMNPLEIRFGSLNEADSTPIDMITEDSHEISTSHTVVTSMVGEAGHHQVIVDDEPVTAVTSMSRTAQTPDVDNAELNLGDIAPQVAPSAPEAEETPRPANQAQRTWQNRNRYHQARYYNKNGNNNANNNENNSADNNGSNIQNRQRSEQQPQEHQQQQQKSRYRNHPQQHQQQPQYEQTNDRDNWQTNSTRYPRPNCPQENQYSNGPGGNGGGRGGFRGRGRGGMRGGYGGNGQQHPANSTPSHPPQQQGYRGNYRRPYNANKLQWSSAPTTAVPVAQ